MYNLQSNLLTCWLPTSALPFNCLRSANLFKYITVCFQLHSNFSEFYSDDQTIPLLDCNVIRIQQICCSQLSTELHDGNLFAVRCTFENWESICLNTCHVPHCNPTRCSSWWLAWRRYRFLSHLTIDSVLYLCVVSRDRLSMYHIAISYHQTWKHWVYVVFEFDSWLPVYCIFV